MVVGKLKKFNVSAIAYLTKIFHEIGRLLIMLAYKIIYLQTDLLKPCKIVYQN